MRPTYLKFRSPKEQTGEFLYPQVNCHGLSITNNSFYVQSKSTFPRSKRWEHIDEVARRTAFHVGPGAYHYKMTTNKGLCPKIRPDTAISFDNRKDVEYLYVGHVILRQEKSQVRSQSQPRDARFSLNSNRAHDDSDISNPTRSNKVYQKAISLPLRSNSKDNRPSSVSRRTPDVLYEPFEPQYLKRTQAVSNRVRFKRSSTERRESTDNHFSKTQNVPSRGVLPKSREEIESLIQRTVPVKVKLS